MGIKMVVDSSNLLFRVASMVEKRGEQPGGSYESDEQKAAFALHLGLNSLLKYYRKYRPDEIALAFEGRNNWRKSYTTEHKAQISKQYKANRLPSDKSASFFELIDSFKSLVRDHTSMILLAVDGLEGDDVIAGYVQEQAELCPNDKVVLISGDKDFLQLGRFKNFMLIDPASGKDRLASEPNFNADYFIFEKCIRGDAGDNVMSAFPRVRKTRLDKAWTDDYEMTQLMQEEWTSPLEDAEGNALLDAEGKPMVRVNKVGTLYEHNKVLMDLTYQPPEVRAKIKAGIAEARANVGRFNNFHFMRFLGKHELNAIAEQAHIYTEMFSTRATKNQLTSVDGPVINKIEAKDALKASEYLNKSAKESKLLEF